MKKLIFPILFTLTALLVVGIYTNAQDILSENVIRLHVIANSDSKEDQAVKLLVRDAILDEFSAYEVFDSKQMAESYIENHLKLAKETAKRVLTENGFSYNVNVEYGRFSFPRRHYGDITLPAGMYDGLRIRLGEGKGQNWWCVMYPPLCFNEANSGTNTYDDANVTFNFKFKLMEIFKSL